MSLLDRVNAAEARRERELREDLEALSHATGGAAPRRSSPKMSPFTRAALERRLPPKAIGWGR